MAALSAFLPDVEPHCQKVPIPTAERAILHAAREFCEKSGYWRVEQLFTTVTDESATGQYTLTFTAGSELVSVVNPIYHGKEEVYLKSEQWLYANYTKEWRTRTGQQADYFIMPSKK